MSSNFKIISWQSSDGLALKGRDYPANTHIPGLLPVVCLHGLTRNVRDFDDIATYLSAQGRRVISLDMRGRGQSEYDTNKRNYRPDVYARDVDGFLESLGIERAHFIGTSLGGLIIVTLAGYNLSRIAGAVLNDIGPSVDPAGIARIASYAGQGAHVKTWDDAVAYTKMIGIAAYPNFTDVEWQKMARCTFRENEHGLPAFDYDAKVFRAIKPLSLKMLSALLWFKFRKLARNRPTLLLRGGISDLLADKTVTRLKKQVPTLLSVEVPNVGHAPWLTEPVATEAVDGFLSLSDKGWM
ncbi:alpha/beta fold hydrolase [Kordiimonas pumila]|uniref:Alpha/beta fold hydrolase n=1 Tax=Kordiimonas pumila TaxID=2161677 RepID=A0ABV7D7E7_9PROT|nr:alpha/beta hydrolase [Kordiimonas pumila]